MKGAFMTAQEFTAIGGVFMAFGGLLFGVYKTLDGKVGRSYKRLDDVKDKIDTNYTKKEVCEVTHKSVDNQLLRIGADVTEIKNDIKIILKNNGH